MAPPVEEEAGEASEWNESEYNDYESFGDASCAAGYVRRGAWTGGAEWLFVQPSFSESVAYVQSSIAGQNSTQTRIDYDFDYESTVRAFVGYRRCDCGGELLFTYTRLKGDAQAETPFATNTTIFTGTLEINTEINQSLASSADVDLDTYDLDFLKHFNQAHADGSPQRR